MSIVKYHNLPKNEQLLTLFKVKNVNQLPTIEKVVVNVGIGKLEKDQRVKAEQIIASIIGQKLALTKAKKSVAGFKTRAGQIVGMRATLRGQHMWLFLNKLINVSIPRTRDFRGLKMTGVTEGGCLNIGIRDLGIFPEVKTEGMIPGLGMQICVVTSGSGIEDTKKYLVTLGFPLEK